MIRKTLGRDRVANRSAKPSSATIRKLPRLASQHDEDHAVVLETSTDSDNDIGDDRVADSNDSMAHYMKENCNRSPHDINDIYVDLLDETICITCNQGGEVLVCSESDCPVALHAKCISCEPKFDDKGNFYCPYCWYKRALAELQELQKKARISKKALSNFLDKNMVTGDEQLKKVGADKRKELKELSLAEDGSCLDGHNRKTGRASAIADQHGIAVGGEAHANASVANTEEFRRCREEWTPIHIEMVHNSMNREKFNVSDISKMNESRFVGGEERMEIEDPRQNNEEVDERTAEYVEEAKPLCATSHLGNYIDRHSPGIAFSKGMQESVAVSAEHMDRMEDGEKLLQNELEMPATGSSVRGTMDSDLEARSVIKRRVKHKAQKKPYPLKIAPVRAISYKEIETVEKNACNEIEGDATAETLRQQPQWSSEQDKKLTLTNARRRRLNWTAEEENMLKEGVLKFSMENKNIPWRTILKYGVHVFDQNRTPVDLKDKWKNITAKEGCK